MEIALEYRDFGFAFKDDAGNPGSSLFSGVNWAVERGGFHVLVGATGSGKTTLLRSAISQLKPAGAFEGEVLVSGSSIEGLPVAQSASLVGYVAQNPDSQIICDTVWHQMSFALENLSVPQDQMRRSIAEVCHFLGIAPWFGKQTRELSGGQRQLLNIASVLVMNPKVLLLDEPTSMLDPVAQKDLLHVLMRLNRELGLTIVVATHSPLTFLPYATAFSQVKDGRIESLDAHAVARLSLERPVLEGVAPKLTPVVELRDVYARYGRGKEFVLRSCDALFAEAGIHAVVGGNGSGKSTLLRAIAGLMKPERGRIANNLKSQQALLPQDPKALFVCDSVLEELQEWQKSCDYSDAAIDTCLARYGLDGASQLHPYDLSGGQQQLLALAKLELTSPRLLLLDEPTKGLDPAARLEVLKALKRLQGKGCTVIAATHDLSFAACAADVVHLMFDGLLACSQPAAEFFQQSLFYVPEHDALFNTFFGEEC